MPNLWLKWSHWRQICDCSGAIATKSVNKEEPLTPNLWLEWSHWRQICGIYHEEFKIFPSFRGWSTGCLRWKKYIWDHRIISFNISKVFCTWQGPFKTSRTRHKRRIFVPHPLKCAKIKCAQIRNTVATIELRLILAKFRPNLDQKILKFSSKSDQLWSYY